MKKMRKKALSLLLCFAMLSGSILPAIHALVPVARAEEPVTSWDNGDLTGHCGDANNRKFYPADAPIGYAFYYEGSDPKDSRDAGFYDMILANNNKADDWCDGFYFCGYSESELKDGENDNRIATIHRAAPNAPSYHYSPGIVFTAPYAGTVNFVYQYARLDGGTVDFTGYVMRGLSTGYGNREQEYKFTEKSINGSSGLGDYETMMLRLDVTEGEKIYFVIDSPGGGGMVAHWIKSAEYVMEYTLETDKIEYEAGEAIGVTASVTPGSFGNSDKIKLINAENTVVSEQAAAATVTFSNVSAGDYKVALYHGDTQVKSVDITVKAPVVPDPTPTPEEPDPTPEDPDPDATSWDNGNLVGQGLLNNYDKKHQFLSSPFGYAYWFQGTAPDEDSRPAGFYDMLIANCGGDEWPKGYYFCGTDADVQGTGNQMATLHQAAACAPTYHYSPGFSFTAPRDGKVHFVYQYAVLDGINNGGTVDKFTFYVMRGTSTGYGDNLGSYKATKIVNSGTDGGEYHEVELDVEVSANEKIYFVVDNENGDMVAHWIKSAKYIAEPTPDGEYGNLTARCGNANNRKFYPDDAPIGYAFYYQGTDPDDTDRSAGFYDMILANNGDTGWSNGFYNCALNAGEPGGDTAPARVKAIHQAASCAPSFHYSPGFVYTAPETGMVEFVYQYAGLDNPPMGETSKFTFYVMRESAAGYEDALYSYKPQKSVSSGDGSGSYDEATIKLNVTQGEKIYFVADNADNGHMVAHWIKSAEYVADPTYTLTTDKGSYIEGEAITVTSTVSEGGFSAKDTIQILQGSTVISEKAAVGTVTFSLSAQDLPAGSYRVALIHGGAAVAAAEITIIAATVDPDPGATSWDNGNLVGQGLCNDNDGKHKFYATGTPFGYAFYYQGTDPEDSRAAGFYDMVLAEAGDLDWPKGFYACGLNGSETKDGKIDNRLATLHQAAAAAPSYHYSPGIVFTAPKTGLVELVYQYAGLDAALDKFDFHVMRESAKDYDDALYSYKATKAVSSSSDTGSYDEVTLKLNVTQGEKIYFVVDSPDGVGMIAHWIKSAKYVEDTPTYMLTTDKASYDEGDPITVTSTVSEGGFSATDTVKIISAGSTQAAMMLPAAETVTFSPSAQELPAGSYQVALVHGGLAVATAEITVVAAVAPGPVTSWNNGSMLGDRLKTDEGKHQFLTDPFGYAFFYEGTDPDDTRLYGFHEMLLSNAGELDWPKGFYACSPDVNSGTENQLKAIHQAAAAASTYHYSPGIVFTAPYTGTVKFVYQYAGLDSIDDKFTFYVMRGSAASYSEALETYKPEKAANSGSDLGNLGECTEVTLTVPMTQGEKIYFVVDQEITAGGGMIAHWIKSAEYVKETVQPTYTLNFDESFYREGNTLTLSALVSGGTFQGDEYTESTLDSSYTVRLDSLSDSTVTFVGSIAEDGTVTFIPEQIAEPASQEAQGEQEVKWSIPAGEYKAVLLHKGKEVASARVRVIEDEIPTGEVWEFGDLLTRYKSKFTFCNEDDGSPISYAFYYQGTDPGDTGRPAGFYPMVKANNGDDWSNGFYNCALDAGETSGARVSTIHQGATAAPSYHYSPGYCFTAPYTGTVEFTYQFAKAYGGGGCENHVIRVLREDSVNYSNAIATYTPRATINGEGILAEGVPQTVTLAVNVTEGEKIYFVIDNTENGGMTTHWIKSFRYVPYVPPTPPTPSWPSGVTTPTKEEEYTTPTGISWSNGDLAGAVKNKRAFYHADTPFGYAFFYEGTDPEDPRLAGFYDMVLAEAGDQDWPKGFYACGLTANEVKDGIIDNRLNTLHQAAANGPTYHYSPGIVFTAPYTGTVEFLYQYAGLDSVEDKFTFYVMRDSAAVYGDAVASYKPTKAVSSANGSGGCDEARLELHVTKGEKIYFVTDSTSNGHMCVHWIKAAGYLSIDPSFTLETDKNRYVEEEEITVSSSVTDGEFGAEDTIRIFRVDETKAVLELPVGEVVTFAPSVERMPAGNYRVALIHNGEEVLSREIQIIGKDVPTETFWDNGDITEHCKNKHDFYGADTPFGYAFFYEGTDPEDPRFAGFYDMVMAEAGDQDWPKGFYACGLTAAETKDGVIDNRLNTLHQSVANAPTYHYSPGVVFTAPYTGTVEFIYQYAGLDGVEDKFTFYVMRDSAMGYQDALYAYKPTQEINSASGNGKYDEVRIELHVAKDEKIYFVTDSTGNGHMCAHWIKSAGYLSVDSTYILETDKSAYKDTHSFYDAEGTPFGYAFYYEGTDPEDNRAKGFYTMQMSANQDGWSDGYYNCAMTPEETGFARVSTIHQAAANAPSFHYSPGFVFTAPATGVVEFTYQFAKAYGGGGCDGHIIYVLRDVEDPYDNGVITTFRPTAVISGEGAEAAGTPETQIFTVAVTEGEKIYFVIDNHDANGGMSAHWIKTAKYISNEIPKEDDDLGDPEPPLSEVPDSADANNDPVVDPAPKVDPVDNNKTFPSAAIWGGIALIAAIIAVAVVFVKKKKTADGEKEESKTGFPR